MMIFDPLRDVFDAFDPLGMPLMLSTHRDAFWGHCVLCLLRAFLSFLVVFLNFPLHFRPLGDFKVTFRIFIFC